MHSFWLDIKKKLFTVRVVSKLPEKDALLPEVFKARLDGLEQCGLVIGASAHGRGFGTK